MSENSEKTKFKKGHKWIPHRDFIGKEHLKLYELIKNKYVIPVKLEYPIKTKKSIRIADIAIPLLKIDIEYDEPYWHTAEKDKKRDSELEESGWKTIRITPDMLRMGLATIPKPRQKELKAKSTTPNISPKPWG